MTKKIVYSAIAASVMATSAFATNGATMLSYGTKDKAMGGTGIASANGAMSAIMNPAMIADAKEGVSANVTYMMIDVTATRDGGAAKSSKTDTSVVPTIAYVKPINKNLTVGVDIYGAAGMGVDYASESTLFKMQSELAILKVTAPIAYKIDDKLSLGFTPVFASGSLMMAYFASATFDQTATDTAFSYEVGAAYKASKELTVGAVYKAPISLTYAGVLNSTNGAAKQFQVPNITDELEQPAEMGLGVTYKMGKSTINLDYKTIAWSSAAGYGDFKWDDQSIIGLGYELDGGAWKARFGYSTTNTPLTDGTNNAIDVLNAYGFPAVITSHMTFGGAYDVSKAMSVEAAVVLASGESYTPSSAIPSFGVTSAAATNDQTNVTIGINYKY